MPDRPRETDNRYRRQACTRCRFSSDSDDSGENAPSTIRGTPPEGGGVPLPLVCIDKEGRGELFFISCFRHVYRKCFFIF